MFNLRQNLKNFLGNQDGATAVEYAIIIAGIAAVIVAIVYSIGEKTGGSFSTTTELIR